MFLDEKIVTSQSTPWVSWIIVLNPDGSNIWGWSASTTPYTMVAYYETVWSYDIEYYCEANPWTPLSNANWRVFRVRNTTADGKFFDKTWAWTLFDKQATDLTTVKGYTYS